MAKLSTVTRQLAERRARLAAEVPRLEKLATDIAEQLAKARAELAAVDLILPTFDARVVPELIAPVKAQGMRYGKRGTFKEALLGLLQAAAPSAMSTVELSMRLRHHFDMDFATAEELRDWQENVLRPQLRRLVRQGVLERLKAGEEHNDETYWRVALAGAEGSLEGLRAQAGATELVDAEVERRG